MSPAGQFPGGGVVPSVGDGGIGVEVTLGDRQTLLELQARPEQQIFVDEQVCPPDLQLGVFVAVGGGVVPPVGEGVGVFTGFRQTPLLLQNPEQHWLEAGQLRLFGLHDPPPIGEGVGVVVGVKVAVPQGPIAMTLLQADGAIH